MDIRKLIGMTALIFGVALTASADTNWMVLPRYSKTGMTLLHGCHNMPKRMPIQATFKPFFASICLILRRARRPDGGSGRLSRRGRLREISVEAPAGLDRQNPL